MTLAEAAVALGLSPATLRQQIRNGRFEAYKLGRDWYATPEAIRRYADHHLGRPGRPRRRAARLNRPV